MNESRDCCVNEGKLFNEVLMSNIRGHFACVESDPYSGKRIHLENRRR